MKELIQILISLFLELLSLLFFFKPVNIAIFNPIDAAFFCAFTRFLEFPLQLNRMSKSPSSA